MNKKIIVIFALLYLFGLLISPIESGMFRGDTIYFMILNSVEITMALIGFIVGYRVGNSNI